MAVALTLTYLQSNDSKELLLTDSAGEYDAVTNTDGWGTPNEETSDVVLISNTTASKYHATLDIIYTDSSAEDTTYDTIDLYSVFTSEFSNAYGMEYELNMSHLFESAVAAGTSDDVFPDGVYNVTYTLSEADTSTVLSTVTYNLLLVGVIRALVYTDIYTVPNVYKQKQFNNDERDWQTLQYSLFSYTYYNSLVTNNDDSEISNKLEMLYFLEQRLNN